MAKLLAIAMRKKSRSPMQLSRRALISEHSGVIGDFRGRSDKSNSARQVTIVTRTQWEEACRAVGNPISWIVRRANLFVDGIYFTEDHLGDRLLIGDEVILEVTGALLPCRRMDEVCPGLRKALLPYWRGGAACRVVRAGTIQIGDSLLWIM